MITLDSLFLHTIVDYWDVQTLHKIFFHVHHHKYNFIEWIWYDGVDDDDDDDDENEMI